MNTRYITKNATTISKSVSCKGIGIHTGEMVTLTFHPAPEKTGIVFVRGEREIPARLENVLDTNRSTTIGKNGAHVQTVEHVLAAVKAFGIDNLYIELSNIEPPAAEGSSTLFCDLLRKGVKKRQKETLPIYTLNTPIFYRDTDITLVAIPSDHLEISYTLSYRDPPILQGQFFSFKVTEEIFEKEVAPCRTFCRYEEISHLIDNGLIRGGSLDNAVVIKGDAILSKKGLFFPNEMARHKALDLLGDLSLTGKDVSAHFISIRSGHKTNVAFAKILENALTTE